MLHRLSLFRAVRTVYTDPVLLARPNVPTVFDRLPEQMQLPPSNTCHTFPFYSRWKGGIHNPGGPYNILQPLNSYRNYHVP